MLGLGIAGWFLLPDAPSWLALLSAAFGMAMAGLAIGLGRRAGVAMLVGGLAVASGCGLIWAKAERDQLPLW
jgi:competence protein ComEC